jgi:hypothetical protein
MYCIYLSENKTFIICWFLFLPTTTFSCVRSFKASYVKLTLCFAHFFSLIHSHHAHVIYSYKRWILNPILMMGGKWMPPVYEMSRSLHEKTICSNCYYAILLEMFYTLSAMYEKGTDTPIGVMVVQLSCTSFVQHSDWTIFAIAIKSGSIHVTIIWMQKWTISALNYYRNLQ